MDMERGVCQGGLPSLPTYNVSTDSLPKWVEESGEGYQIGTARIPDLLYVDDNALVTMLIEAMQRLLNIVGAWQSGLQLNSMLVNVITFTKLITAEERFTLILIYS